MCEKVAPLLTICARRSSGDWDRSSKKARALSRADSLQTLPFLVSCFDPSQVLFHLLKGGGSPATYASLSPPFSASLIFLLTTSEETTLNCTLRELCNGQARLTFKVPPGIFSSSHHIGEAFLIRPPQFTPTSKCAVDLLCLRGERESLPRRAGTQGQTSGQGQVNID